MTAAERVLESRTVPPGQAPPTNGNRHGRPFTLRLEPGQEDTLRREMARLELLPFSERPQELFGWGGGSGTRRRASFGWFMTWAALQWCKAAAAAGHKPPTFGEGRRELAGKTRRRPAGGRSTRRKGKTSGRRPRAGKRSKKGGSR